MNVHVKSPSFSKYNEFSLDTANVPLTLRDFKVELSGVYESKVDMYETRNLNISVVAAPNHVIQIGRYALDCDTCLKISCHSRILWQHGIMQVSKRGLDIVQKCFDGQLDKDFFIFDSWVIVDLKNKYATMHKANTAFYFRIENNELIFMGFKMPPYPGNGKKQIITSHIPKHWQYLGLCHTNVVVDSLPDKLITFSMESFSLELPGVDSNPEISVHLSWKKIPKSLQTFRLVGFSSQEIIDFLPFLFLGSVELISDMKCVRFMFVKLKKPMKIRDQLREEIFSFRQFGDTFVVRTLK